MSKIAVLVLTEKGTHESLGRIVNVLEFAKEPDGYDDHPSLGSYVAEEYQVVTF